MTLTRDRPRILEHSKYSYLSNRSPSDSLRLWLSFGALWILRARTTLDLSQSDVLLSRNIYYRGYLNWRENLTLRLLCCYCFQFSQTVSCRKRRARRETHVNTGAGFSLTESTLKRASGGSDWKCRTKSFLKQPCKYYFAQQKVVPESLSQCHKLRMKPQITNMIDKHNITMNAYVQLMHISLTNYAIIMPLIAMLVTFVKTWRCLQPLRSVIFSSCNFSSPSGVHGRRIINIARTHFDADV